MGRRRVAKIYGIYDGNDPVRGNFREVKTPTGIKSFFEPDPNGPHARAGTKSAAFSKAKRVFGVKRIRKLPKGCVKKDGLTGDTQTKHFRGGGQK